MKPSDTLSLKKSLQLHYRSYRDIHRYCPHILTVTVAHAIMSALSPYITIYFSARIIDELATTRREDVLLFLVLLTLGSGVLCILITGLFRRWKEALNAQFFAQINRIYSDKMLSSDFSVVDQAQTHDLLSQIRQNALWNGWGFGQAVFCFSDGIESLLGIAGAATLTISLFTLRVSETAGVLAILNRPILIVIMVGLLLGSTILSSLCQNKAIRYWTFSSENIKLTNRIFNSFGFIAANQKRALDIRIYNQQEMASHYTPRNIDQELAQKAKGPMGLFSAAGAAISTLLTGFIYLFVALKTLGGAFGVGSLTQYVSALTSLTKHFSTLFVTLGSVRSNAAFLQTTYTFLDIPNQMYQGHLTTEKRSDRQYQVEFRNVSFRYPDSDTWTLRHVNVTFNIGKRMAIVGENGSGKSTFIKLLCRLYDPQEGQILLNGIDIRKYEYRDYINLFSIVFQDFQLLAQPLGANVASSCQYSEPRVIQALTDAGFADRLATLPQGLNTMLYRDFAEDGIMLSGGEAQKIAIARALYKDAPFIILDEPTAALDPIAEAEIYSKFNEIVGDKTAIFISHRLSSCKFCDEITVFQGGSIVQHGTHEQLLRDESGQYAKLWNAQAQYYV